MKPKVLIIDDIALNRMTIKLSLKNEGYTFLEASNGKEAIEIAIKEIPDIILMDAMMPVMDGFEATKRIRQIEDIQRIPILMITSLDSKEDKIRALNCGVNDFINKSFDKLELQARCKSYIEISNLNKKYILSTKNVVSGLPNKMELIKDIKSDNKTKELFLIYMDNYAMNENFYGITIAEELDRIFLKDLQLFCQTLPKHRIYHISSGKYAILLDSENKLFEDEAEQFCFNLIKHTKTQNYQYGEYFFDINITMSYAHGHETLYEDANAILNLAQNENREYMLSNNTIYELKENIKKNLKILQVIKTALKEKKIVPFFQPIYNNKTHQAHRYEALIRMYDDNYNLIMPHPYFLEAAKKGKLYHYITKLVIENVLEKIRQNDCEISINLSALDIEDDEMREYLLEVLEQNRDITDKIIFELLEDKETNSYDTVKHFIQKSKRYGVKIAIDDFGSGFSNFIRIIEFEPDIIKIDGSLIKNIETSKASRQTVETIKIFADKIGAKTVAEFVSNREIFNIINEIGIDYSQGFYIGKAKAELGVEHTLLEELATT